MKDSTTYYKDLRGRVFLGTKVPCCINSTRIRWYCKYSWRGVCNHNVRIQPVDDRLSSVCYQAVTEISETEIVLDRL